LLIAISRTFSAASASLAYRENCDFIIFDTNYHVLSEDPALYGYDYYMTIDHFDLYKRRES